MKIETQDYNDVTVVELHGEMDADCVEQLRKIIVDLVEDTLTAETKNAKKNLKHKRGNSETQQTPLVRRVGIVLDMRNVGFIDSLGLELLLWARDYCNDSRCQFRLAGLDENCSKILEITRIEKEFDRYAELAEAVKSFA